LRRIKILIISSASLARVVEYLFLGRAEFEIVGNVSTFEDLEQKIVPDLIILNVKPVTTGIRGVVASIKNYSPMSKLILTCSLEELPFVARQCGADACLRDEKLAGHLVRMARILSARPIAAA